MLGKLVIGSVVLGLIIGVQLAPLLAFMEGAQGERIRLAGWETWRVCRIQASLEPSIHLLIHVDGLSALQGRRRRCAFS